MPSVPLSLYFWRKIIKSYSTSLILTNSLSLPLLFHFLPLSAPPFPLLALPPTLAYIGMEMMESCTLAANIHIQSVRPHCCFSPAIETTQAGVIADTVKSSFFYPLKYCGFFKQKKKKTTLILLCGYIFTWLFFHYFEWMFYELTFIFIHLTVSCSLAYIFTVKCMKMKVSILSDHMLSCKPNSNCIQILKKTIYSLCS